MATLLPLLARASVVLLVALAGWAICRRRSASVRHLWLAGGVAGVLALPLVGAVVPSWRLLPAVGVAAWPMPSTRVAAAATVSEESPEPAPVADAAFGLPTRAQVERAAVLLWAAGAGVGCLGLLLGLGRLRRDRARGRLVTDARWLETTGRLAHTLGVTPPPVVAVPGGGVGTWGFRRPVIAIPTEGLSWPDARIEVLLAHELGHIARGDWAVQVAARAVCAVHWCNPLAWVVARRLRDDAERACDDVVLALGVSHVDYAEHLLTIARAGTSPTPAMAMARFSSLERRLTAMLNTRIDRTVPSSRSRLAVAGLLAVAVSGVATLTVAAQGGPVTLRGAVYDSSGGVLPAVEMALVNEAGIRWTTPTDGQGAFEFAPVGPGDYVLEASVPGLRSLKQKVTIDGSRDITRDVTLRVGDLMETITVVAKRPQKPAPLAPAATAARVRVGGNVKPPRKTRDVRPVYPEAMRAAGREGLVPVEALIGPNGRVISARVLSAQVHPEFASAAVDAVRQWEFTPTLLNGVPSEVSMAVSISFSLSD